MSNRCRLCRGTAVPDDSYCNIHHRAYIEIKLAYRDWSSAFENMSWERYLDTIIGLNETGVSAKEVAIEELRLSESDSRRLLSKNRFENYGDQEKGTD